MHFASKIFVDKRFKIKYNVLMKLNKRKIDIELTRLKWSKYRLAQEMGVKRQWVYAILGRDLGREGSCTLRTVDRIARALGADPKDLLI